MSEARKVDVLDPRTGKVDFKLDCADAAEVKAKAVELRKSQHAWQALGVEGRVAVLKRWSEGLKHHGRAIGDADARDTGGALSSQVPRIVQGFIAAHTAAAPAQYQAMFREGVSGTAPGMTNIKYDTVLKPFPLVGVISPWNAPTMLTMHRSILPLLAGCAVLVKPSEVTPRFVAPLKASMADVPELASVFDFVLGDGATGAAVIEEVDFISFTGSVPNGRKVAQACAGRFIPCELELGGKDPLVITATANVDDAVSATVRGACSGTGQVCFSIERVYVERPLCARYLEALTERVGKVRLRHPNPNEGEIGPFTMRRQASIVDSHLDDALAKGATILTGGKSFELDGGLYMKPTILTGVMHDMKIMREETFGPVIPVMAYDTPDEAVALANDTDFGLSAAVIAGTDAEATAIASRINAGNVSVQDSFLTFAAAPAESDSFGASGLGGKRTGIQRYLKRQALLHNRVRPVCLTEPPRMAAE
jgi:succinate-semialdehyde dehydrogenase / glutarate-semialdehyde dehydrogenase